MAILPIELYLMIIEKTNECPLKYRVCKYIEKYILGWANIREEYRLKIYELLIVFGRNDLIAIYSKNVSPNIFRKGETVFRCMKSGYSHLDDHLSSPLIIACKFGRISIVRHLISDADILIGTLKPLRIAIEMGHHRLVSFLLKNEKIIKWFDVDHYGKDAFCDSLLLTAICNDDHAMINILLTCPYMKFNTPPVRLLRHGIKTESLAILLGDMRFKFEIDEFTKMAFLKRVLGTIPQNEWENWITDEILHKIVEKDKFELIKILLSRNIHCLKLLIKSIELVKPRIVNLVTPHIGDKSIIVKVAAKYGNLGIVKEFLNDIDPTIDNNIILIDAVKHGHSKIVELLFLDGRIDPSFPQNLAIKIASKYGYMKTMNILLSDKRVNPKNIRAICRQKKTCHGRDSLQKILKNITLDERDFDNLRPMEISNGMTID
jgi:hypothetical protein